MSCEPSAVSGVGVRDRGDVEREGLAMLKVMFTRSQRNPILTSTDRWWEARAVLNPGAAIVDGRVVIVYRAVGGDGLSRFGLAWSEDGERLDERAELPLYEGAIDD